jgi:hypothetical protein
MLRLLRKITFALAATLFIAFQWLAFGGSPALAHHNGPHATITLWPLVDPTACGPDFPVCPPSDPAPGLVGFSPNETDEDPYGLTEQVVKDSKKLTMVTNINGLLTAENLRTNGIIYWNPATNVFKSYGVTVGISSGIDVNLRQTAYTEGFGKRFQQGDVWSAVRGDVDASTALYVHFRGTKEFRRYTLAGPSGVIGANAVAVHPNGDVFFTAEDPFVGGFIGRLDPKTNDVTSWPVGAGVGYLAIDSKGMVYATVSNALALGGVSDAIVRLNPSIKVPTEDYPNLVAWGVPGEVAQFCPNECLDLVGGPYETPNGIDLDSAGNVWFAQTQSNEIGRLDPVSGKVTEFTGTGVLNPQQVGVRGSGSSVEAFFTEGDGEAVSRVIPRHFGSPAELMKAKPVQPLPCITVPTTTLKTCKAVSQDESINPQQTEIKPLVYQRPAYAAPGPHGDEIYRWAPMPAPPLPDVDGVADPNDNCTNIVVDPPTDPSENPVGRSCHPSGMTDVTGSMTVFGSYLDPLFQGTSAVFRLYDPPDGPAPQEPPLIPALEGWKRVLASGSIPAANGKKATFSIAVDRAHTTATPSGRIRYTNAATGEKVVSTAIQSVTVAGNAATITGTCTNNGVSCSFTVVVTDNGIGLPETFSITGQGVGPATGSVGNGNVTIYSK